MNEFIWLIINPKKKRKIMVSLLANLSENHKSD